MSTRPASATPTKTLATSHEIRDRGSTFIAYIYRARTVDEASAVLADRRHTRGIDREHSESDHGGARVPKRTQDKGESEGEDQDQDGDGRGDKHAHKGVHEPYVIAAWRCMVVKPGRTGLSGPDDFVVVDGCEDGGERWAGERVLGVMKRQGVIDAMVVVCRLFGGTLLGPVRFTHIENCASEVCRRFKKIEEMDECVQTLRTLDDLLATLRAELATARKETDSGSTPEGSHAKPRVPDYHAMQDSLDLTKAKRLVHARECAIEATKSLIEKCKTST